jgi:hypothetical protein
MTKQQYIETYYRHFLSTYRELSPKELIGKVMKHWEAYRELTMSDEFIQFERKISSDGNGRNMKVSIPKDIKTLFPKAKKYKVTIEAIKESL